MESLTDFWMRLGEVPWQQWAALAAAGWLFALVSFNAASTGGRSTAAPRAFSTEFTVLHDAAPTDEPFLEAA